MAIRKPSLLNLPVFRLAFWIIGATAFGLAAPAQDDPGSVFPQPAYTAEQFVDFIGLNAGVFDRYLDSGPFKGAGTKYAPETFFNLGVRHYRCGLKSEMTLPDATSLVKAAYARYGAKPMFLISPGKSGSPQEVVQLLKDYGGAEVVGGIEGPNEVNNKFPPQELNLKYGGKIDEAAGAAFMVDYNKALKADPATKGIPFISYTAIFTDYRLARPCDAFDYSNMHSYQGSDVPSASLLQNFVRSNHLLPGGAAIKPFVPTECGYNVGEDKSNHLNDTNSLRSQALNIPMLLGEYFRHGFIRRAYLFALNNADGYGLLEGDQVTKRPSYYALQSLIAALKDATWNPRTRLWEGGQFTPKALLFTVGGAPRTLKSVTLEKANGEYSILIWNELLNWDPKVRRDLDNPPIHVTLRFTTPVQPAVQALRQDASGAFKSTQSLTVTDNALSLDVPSSVTIVCVRPANGTEAVQVAPPLKPTGIATENSVRLSWSAARGASPAGYFVFRNGWCIASTGTTSIKDESPWIRPGLGYTYTVRAYDSVGNMSAPATAIVTTPSKYPDYVITDFGLDNPAPHPGDQVRFRARIMNIGDGASPVQTPLSVTFSMDGRIISWGGVPAGPAPGAGAEIVANGGPHPTPFWTATEGAHLLKADIDDINRIPEESNKVNNVRDKTIIIGSTFKGMLSGASEAAPWRVDLSREGTEDWVHWGLNDGKAVNRRAGAHLISDLAIAGAGFVSWTSGFAVRSSWTDGSPVRSNAGANASLWFNGVGGAYHFTVPADAGGRILRIYAGGVSGASCTLTASLSDNSAPPYVSKTWSGNSGLGNWAPVPGDFAVLYTLRYHAATSPQTLAIDFKLDNEPNRFLGQARLGAATLCRVSDP